MKAYKKEKRNMNILLAINNKYIEQVIVLLKSMLKSNPNEKFHVYILNKCLNQKEKNRILQKVNSNNMEINFIKVAKEEIDQFPVYEKRYPVEIYFRLYATKYLPKEIDRILYLDVDIVVINSLHDLYHTDFENNLFIGTTHIRKAIHKFHEVRLGLKEENVYVNTGVLLMNLKELRKIPIESEVESFIHKNKKRLMLPDQDILSTLYGDRIKLMDPLKYNLGDRGLKLYNYNHSKKIDLEWVRENAIIIHYYGRNKPWNKQYKGILNVFYDEIYHLEKSEYETKNGVL